MQVEIFLDGKISPAEPSEEAPVPASDSPLDIIRMMMDLYSLGLQELGLLTRGIGIRGQNRGLRFASAAAFCRFDLPHIRHRGIEDLAVGKMRVKLNAGRFDFVSQDSTTAHIAPPSTKVAPNSVAIQPVVFLLECTYEGRSKPQDRRSIHSSRFRIQSTNHSQIALLSPLPFASV